MARDKNDTDVVLKDAEHFLFVNAFLQEFPLAKPLMTVWIPGWTAFKTITFPFQDTPPSITEIKAGYMGMMMAGASTGTIPLWF